MKSDNVFLFKKPIKSVINIEDLLTKCYSDRKINNVLQELMMVVDKGFQDNDWEFNSASDRDYVADETYKFLLNIVKLYVRRR